MNIKKFLTSVSMVAVLGSMALPATAADLAAFGSYWDTTDADQAFGFGTRLRFARFVELRATYFRDATADAEPDSLDFDVSVIPVEAGLVFQFAEDAPFSPYVGGGGGYYLLNSSDVEIDDEVGWYAVAGADFGRLSSGLAFNVEAIYRSMEATVTDDEDGLPGIDEEVDFDLSGIGLNAGVVFRF